MPIDPLGTRFCDGIAPGRSCECVICSFDIPALWCDACGHRLPGRRLHHVLEFCGDEIVLAQHYKDATAKCIDRLQHARGQTRRGSTRALAAPAETLGRCGDVASK